MALRYSRNTLRRIETTVGLAKLQPIIWSTLKDANLLRIKPTKRGNRGGTKLQRPIKCATTTPRPFQHPSISRGANLDNLIKVQIIPGVHEAASQPNILTVKYRPVTFRQSSRINLCLWNARSVTQKVTPLCDFIVTHNIDLMCLTETWFTGDDMDKVTVGDIKSSLAGYKLVSAPRSTRRGGGVALLAKETLKTKVHKADVYRTFEHLDITVTSNSDVIRLLLLYRPPSSKATGSISDFIEEFACLLEKTMLSAGHLLLTGDYNIHVDNRESRDAVKFLELLSSYDLKQHVSTATHSRGHTLDLVITRTDDTVIHSVTTHHDLPSDHCAVACSLLVKRPAPLRQEVSFRRLRKLDVEEFKADIADTDLLLNISPPSLAQDYDSTLRRLLDKHAPSIVKVVTVRPQAPWFTEELHDRKVIKRKAERRFKKSGLEVHRQIFKDESKSYAASLDDAKTKYYRDKISESDCRGLFKLVNERFGKAGKKVLPTNCDASAFMTYFTDKIATIRQAMDVQVVGTSPVAEVSCESSLSSWSPVSCADVTKIIMKFPRKSSQLDPIPSWLFTSCLPTLLPVVTSIINTSLSTGVVPECFKHATISPLIKKPSLDPESLASYRPVSNLPYLSKCLERVVAQQLQLYLDSHSLYDPMQSAYRPQHSTETTLLKIQNDLLMAVDGGTQVVLLLLDLSAAFDTIDHEVLLHRLRHRYGIDHLALRWFRSYLQKRTQAVVVPGSTSGRTSLTWGVPQGSVLGPVLFSLYMAPLGDLITSHGVRYLSYADDTQLYVTLQEDSSLSQLHLCVEEVRLWMLSNKLKLNDSKTELIMFSSRFKPNITVPSFHVGDSVVELSNCVKDLGVTLDNHLTLGSHVQGVCRTATFGLRSIARVRKYLDQQTCERLVHAYVSSKLDYCNSLLYGLPGEMLNRIQRIQNNAARVVTRIRKSDHITPVLAALHWLPVRHRITFKILLITFKLLQNNTPDYLRSLLHVRSSLRRLRSSSTTILSIPRTKSKAFGDRAFEHCAPVLWNQLPDDIKNCQTLASFKSKLKTHLFIQAF